MDLKRLIYHFAFLLCLLAFPLYSQEDKSLTITVEETIPDTVLRDELVELTVFSSSANFQLNPKIKSLSKLKSLSVLLEGERFEIPEWIGEMTQLEELYFKWNATNIPASIGNLNRLRALSIIGHYEQVPVSIQSLKNLEYLNLESDQLSVFPVEVYQLHQLAFLAITNSKISKVPKGINQLNNLEFLDLGRNQIETIPTEVGFCKSLVELNIHENKITPYDYQLISASNENLIIKYDYRFQKFQITRDYTQLASSDQNRATSVKAALKMKKKCEILDLSNTENINEELKLLEKKASKLSHIKVIRLSGNHLASIPDFIFDFKDLQELYINDNDLVELPIKVLQLKALKVLSVSANQMGTLPIEMLRLHQLNKLVIDEFLVNWAMLKKINECMPYVQVIYKE